MPARANFIYSPFFVVSCFISVLVVALGFSRFSQSNDSAYSAQILPLLVETIGKQTFHGLTHGEHYVVRVVAVESAEVGIEILGVGC